MTPPEDEKWRPVKGHDDYAEIVAGDRKGQYGQPEPRRPPRRGVHDRGARGQDRARLQEGRRLGARGPDRGQEGSARRRHPQGDLEPPKGETWGPVKGAQSYADILSGPRNGYYVNLQQGSVREGQVFHIVKRGGKEYHVYGEGDDKVWVEVGATKKKSESSTTTGTEATTPASGAADTRDASQTGSRPPVALPPRTRRQHHRLALSPRAR